MMLLIGCMEVADMSILRCDPQAWVRCPNHNACGWPAEFMENSECDYFNDEILSGGLVPDIWIPVSVRLPHYEFLSHCRETGEKELEVLCVIDGATESTILRFDGSGFFDGYKNPYRVTHWMPKPAVPVK